jgi:hypothetical protein
VLPHAALAHNVSKRDASFGVSIAAFMYLGAKHMVTGYDYLAFLVGVISFRKSEVLGPDDYTAIAVKMLGSISLFL